MKVIKSVADKILVLKDGNLVEYNKSEEIFNYPKKEYTKTLLSSLI